MVDIGPFVVADPGACHLMVEKRLPPAAI